MNDVYGNNKYQSNERLSMVKKVCISSKKIVGSNDQQNSTAAIGPEGIPVIFIKECKNKLTQPKHVLFKKSIQYGVYA